ncbi:MAG: LacI family DNA-binding transcriptional regulator, partial [Bullifex sp.]
MITLKDISDSCGVGISTISRVLSGDRTRKIRKETEQLVIRTASELGYFREKKLKIHASDREVRIAGLFLSDHESILNPFFSEVFVGIK